MLATSKAYALSTQGKLPAELHYLWKAKTVTLTLTVKVSEHYIHFALPTLIHRCIYIFPFPGTITLIRSRGNQFRTNFTWRVSNRFFVFFRTYVLVLPLLLVSVRCNICTVYRFFLIAHVPIVNRFNHVSWIFFFHHFQVHARTSAYTRYTVKRQTIIISTSSVQCTPIRIYSLQYLQ